ncbi:hypothetical protein H7F15_18480 [Pontibacter sp. Tf4]|uniref:hypothetical protein n=1 Tax=Pontibacter sp. Tf4 TaxID=2761620 RepID=UPI001623C11A|nr:hypothetical protein [Pontibacter sp. Tf4]MBB6613034.1 hypothetical protein [Pontibacter sp. Tf4]
MINNTTIDGLKEVEKLTPDYIYCQKYILTKVKLLRLLTVLTLHNLLKNKPLQIVNKVLTMNKTLYDAL